MTKTTSKPMLYVLAATFKEATDWAAEHGLRYHEWLYVDQTDRLRGVVEPMVVHVLGCWRRRDFDEVLTFAACDRGARFVDSDTGEIRPAWRAL